MTGQGETRRRVLECLSAVGASSLVGTPAGLGSVAADTAGGRLTSALETNCSPGHTTGHPACQQIADDSEVLIPLRPEKYGFPFTFWYPCGWEVTTSDEYADRVQANVTRSDIGEENAYVDVQVRVYDDPVARDFIQRKQEEGEYVKVSYLWDGQERTGLVSSPETAQFGTVGHAVVPIETNRIHVEFVSTLKGAHCENYDPRPDYGLVRDMLGSLGKIPASVTIENQLSDNGQVLTVSNGVLPVGGFISIHDQDRLQNADPVQSLLGASKYLPAGEKARHTNIQVTLDDPLAAGETTVVAMVHRDSDGDAVFDFGASNGKEDDPYMVGGRAVTDSATILVPTPTPTDESESHPTTTTREVPPTEFLVNEIIIRGAGGSTTIGYAGNTQKVVGKIGNPGKPGTQVVKLLVNGTIRDRTRLQLDTGERQEVTFSWETSVSDVGRHRVSIETENSSDAVSVTLKTGKPPYFAVSTNHVHHIVSAGDSLDLRTTVTNRGDLTDTQTISLVVNGTRRDSTTVTLSGGVSTDVTLSWEPSANHVGEHSVSIASANESEQISIEVEEGVTEGAGDPGLGVGVTGLAIVAAGLVDRLRRCGRNSQN